MLYEELLHKQNPSSKPRSVALIPLLSILCIVYFVYHLINGDRGIKSYLKLNQKITGAQKDLDYLAARKKTLEDRIAFMSPQHMDPELADERIRTMLGFAKSNEKIIYFNAPTPSAKDYNVIIVPEISE